VNGYGVTDQLRLITKGLNCEILGTQPIMYEVVKAFMAETSLIQFSVVTILQNFILLPTYVLHQEPLFPCI
jgi:hypothetical protein